MNPTEVAVVALGAASMGLLSSLVAAVLSWRRRSRSGTVSIVVTDQEGRRLRLEADHADLTYEQAALLFEDLAQSEAKEEAAETNKQETRRQANAG